MRVSHLAAMATLIALLGAMFVAMGSASAQQPPYVAVNLLVDFPQDSDDTIAAGTSTQVRLRVVATPVAVDAATPDADTKVGDIGTVVYTLSTPTLTYVRASDGLILKTAAETGVVLAGDEAGVLLNNPTLTTATTPNDWTVSESSLQVIVPAGTDDGPVTVSAAVVTGVQVAIQRYVSTNTADDPATPGREDLQLGTATSIFVPANADNSAVVPATRSASGVLTVGNVDEVDSISFGLSSPKRDSSTASGYSSDPGTREPSAISIEGGSTEFTLRIHNANDKPSQIKDVSSIVVSTTGGTMAYSGNIPDGVNREENAGQCTGNSTTCELEPSRTAANALPAGGLRFLLRAPNSTGDADIRVVVISRAGNVLIDESQMVKFVGRADMLEAGEASGTVLGYDVVGANKPAKADHDTDSSPDMSNADTGSATRDQIRFTVRAVDKGGTTVATPSLNISVTGPDGVAVSSAKFGPVVQTGDANEIVHVDVDTGRGSALKAGEHKIRFSAGSLSATSMFTVVGLTDAVSLETSDMAPDTIGDEVSITATLTDEDGNPVADGTVVKFRASDKTGDNDSVLVSISSEMPGTKGGVASVDYVVVGSGSAVVTAIVQDTTGMKDVAVVQSSAGDPTVVAPEPEPEVASVDCLSNLSGFSTWTCGVDADVSEIFTMVSERGVTAIHLWNGTNWVRYSVVSGSEVPGSSDFKVTQTDILYISQ